MKIACVSGSNTRLMGDKSASTRVCTLIGDIIKKEFDSTAAVDIIPFAKFNLKPCVLCGGCYETSSCIYEDDFNEIFARLSEADAIFFVVPHYSPIPSKLLILFEKLNEIAYASWLNNPDYSFPLGGKPAGIIGHGGMAESDEVLKYYHDNLITPVANTLRSLSLDVTGLDETFINGVPYGLKDDKCLVKIEGSIFPEITQDYILIENRIKPLIENVLSKLDKQ